MTNRSWARGCFALFAAQCATPTAVTAHVWSEVPCSAPVSVFGRDGVGDMSPLAPSATSMRCDDSTGTSDMGTVVVVPTTSKTQVTTLAFATRTDGSPADDCLRAGARGCIVARREVHFQSHVEAVLRVDLRLSCRDVDCPVGQTCVKGSCASSVVDLGQCNACDEGALTPVPASYSALADPSKWSFRSGVAASVGGAFDGRYVYYAPATTAKVPRYDTQRPFDDPTAWDAFDLTGVAPTGYAGAAFDGRWVYLVPSSSSSGPVVIVRYDIAQPFAAPASWQTFDVRSVFANAGGFYNAIVAMPYLYFIPYSRDVLVRFDTRQSLTAASAWAAHDFSTSHPGLQLGAGTFDGTAIIMAPRGLNAQKSLFVRYDVGSDFASEAGFSYVDVGGLDPHAVNYKSLVYDGTWIYAQPWGIFGESRFTLRFRPSAPFALSGFLGVNSREGGFDGGAFDGRYVYGSPISQNAGATVQRFDSTRAFDDLGAYETFDIQSIHPGAARFHGVIFDGRALYFAPELGVAARFVARDTATHPPGFGAEWY